MKKWILMMVFFFSICISREAQCAEVEVKPSASMNGAPVMEVGKDYWASTNGLCYVSFVTPSDGGYLEVEYKNISISSYAYAIVCNSIGEELAKYDCYTGNEKIFPFRSEPGKRNGATMEPNTKYYIRIGKEDYTGNVKLSVRFRKDVNPDGKEYAESISLNTKYIRSIDGCTSDDDDHDYFKFTAKASGAHHFTINNSCDSYLNYEIRKWNSDELVQKTNGYDMKDDTYKDNTKEYDIVLEKGQTYFLHVWHDRVGNYTFSISDQHVTGISMPSSKTMKPGEDYTLNPTVYPGTAYNKTLKFSSSDTNVAYVNSSTGEVHAYSAGKTIITAQATDGSETKATCTIYVTPKTPGSVYWSKSSESAINLYWYSVSGVSGYTVYRTSGSKWIAVKNTKATKCTVSKLKAGTGYKFRIKAYTIIDGKKYYSTASTSTAMATNPKKTSISSIKKLKKKKSGSGYYYRAKITWKKSSGASYYEVYYKASGSSYKSSLGTYKGTSTTVQLYRSKYTTGTKKYTFYVVPVKSYGNKKYSGSYSKGKTYTFK